jgi:murein DD-endopeptidase MepM/ murein hydrolase activator NlpD
VHNSLFTPAKRKGVGTTIAVIIFIIIILIFPVMLMSMVSENANKKTYLNLEDAALLKMKNTFYLLKKSLGMTWFVSTVQAIFRAGDEGFGCGYGEIEEITDMKNGYWFQTEPGKGKQTQFPAQYCATPLPQPGKKYNEGGCNPMICTPNTNHLISYMDSKMEYTHGQNTYHKIKTSFAANDVNVVIADDDPEKIDTDFTVSDASIETATKQKIKLNDYTFDMETNVNELKSDVKINTYMKKMVEAGRDFVNYLLVISNNHPDYSTTTDNAEMYKSIIETMIGAGITAAQSKVPEAKININYDTFGLVANVLGTDEINDIYYGDLVLHYDAEVKIIEGQKSTPDHVDGFDWPAASRNIIKCYGPFIPAEQDKTGFNFGIDIAPLASGNNVVSAVKNGKITEVKTECTTENCDSFGKHVIIEHEDGYMSFYGHLDDVSVSKDDSVDQGEKIGTIGSTGKTTEKKLYLEIRRFNEKLDPCQFLDCTQPTGKKCDTISIKEDEEQYYYHDEEHNRFAKRPFSLIFKVEDYLPAIKCWWDPSDTAIYKFYTWKNSQDLACCGNVLWCCAGSDCANIINLPPERIIQDGQCISDNLCPSSYGLMCSSGSFSVENCP